MRFAVALAALLAAPLAGCGANSPMDNEPESRVLEATATGPDHASAACERGFVRSEVESFVAAMDSGSRPALDAAIADEPAFRQFSHSLDYRKRSQRFWRAKAKARLVDHLEERAARGDRIRLVSLETGQPDRSLRICNISFLIWREIGDLDQPGERFVGKGAVSMGGGVAVWNTGPPKRLAR